MAPGTYPDGDDGERALLTGTLALLREAVIAKTDGLTETQGRWTPDGRLISLVGIVHHLAQVEWRWIDGVFLGAEVSRSEAEFEAAGVSLAVAVENYRRRGQVTDEAVQAASSLDQLAVGLAHRPRNLRRILVHLIQETARRAGHADAARELLDGTTGE